VPWLREVIKEWARDTRPYLQSLRQALRACGTASATLVAAGRVDPTALGTGDFTAIIDTISDLRRADGSLHSAQHRNLLLYLICEVVEHGRAGGLMAQIPDPFRPARRHRVRSEPNEDELGKALPEAVIRQLDGQLHLLGPAGRAGSVPAVDLQQMQQTIYRIMRDTGRRPGEVVSLRVGAIELIDGQHNLIYDNHKAARMRRRLPITTETAEVVMAWNVTAHSCVPHQPCATGCSPASCCAPNRATVT
jgi:integrase